MGTYEQAGNQAKVIDTANRLLAANPNSVPALVLLSYNQRAQQKWTDAEQNAIKGLQALPNMPKPEGSTDDALPSRKLK